MAVDLLCNDNLELVTANGDLALGEAEITDVKAILLAVPGSFLQHYSTGVNIRQWVAAPINPKERSVLMREIKVQLKADGKENARFTGTGEKFSIVL